MIFKNRKCKYCKEIFTPIQNMQYLCLPPRPCSWEYQKLLKENKEKKEWMDKKKIMKVETHSKEHKRALQNEINKLARMIDASFNFSCIDCGKPYGKQVDGAHYHGRGSNNTLRYNLHNIHSAKSDCNQYSDKHKEGYTVGLNERYGFDYFKMISNLPAQYKEIHLSNVEVIEKLAIVRKLIRDFKTFTLHNGMTARYLFNKIIGVYN